jgi:IS30 family transposase
MGTNRRPNRPKLGSLGSPGVRRDVRRRFWRLVGHGLQTNAAAELVGVSHSAACKWFVEAGGMPPMDLAEPSGRYLSFAEREEIAIMWSQKLGVREIARRLERAPSTISRELHRNAATRASQWLYRASSAQWHAERRLARPKVSKLASSDRLREYVQSQLAGPGRWSPEQISRRLVRDFPDDESMRISHEAIYQALYVQGRGALRRELTACLRTGRALRKPARRATVRGKRSIPAEIMISERPAEVEDRAVPGHWEGDLIVGSGSSAIGTLVERKTRFLMLVHLPRLADLAHGERGWSGRGAETVRDALAATIVTLPSQLRRTLTWDQGSEMSTRPAQDRRRHRHLLLRPPQPLAARHEREHQWPATPVLPQRQQPEQPQRPTPRRGRSRPQRQTTKDTQLANPSRSTQRRTTLDRKLALRRPVESAAGVDAVVGVVAE